MNTYAMRWWIGAVLILALAVVSANVGTASAAGLCPAGVDGCLVVNSNADDNIRDDALTLREALLVSHGAIPTDALTKGERAQVAGAIETMGATVGVYFDPDVFCETCATNTITLSPPGLGGPAIDMSAYTGEKLLALPPGLGGPAVDSPPGLGGPAVDSPPGLGGPALLGMGSEDGREVPATVVIDGSALSADYVGLWAPSGGWLRGLRFENFAGHAIEVDADAAGALVLGHDGDGVHDDAETVLFAGNGADLVVIGD